MRGTAHYPGALTSAGVFLLSLVAQLGFLEAGEGGRKNFIIILADDLGYGDLACYGNRLHKSPHIDRLAGQSVRFSNAWCGAPICTPSRASLLTGRSPARSNLTRATMYSDPELKPQKGMPAPAAGNPWAPFNNPECGNYLPLEETTIAEILRAQGYRTGIVGKWHLGAGEFGPGHRGFDFLGSVSPHGSPLSYFPPYGIPGLDDERPGEYLTDRITREANQFLRADDGRPFFLYVSHYAPHVPLQAPRELVEKYRREFSASGSDRNPVYAAMIEELDKSVGSILETVSALGLSDDTTVVFLSDNGGLVCTPEEGTPLADNGELRGGKGMIYEGGLRIPYLIRTPGAEHGVSDIPVSTMDILPTILDLAGLQKDSPALLDGASLRPVLQGGLLPQRPIPVHFPHYVSSTVYPPTARSGEWATVPSAVLREGDWKLVRPLDETPPSLFDLRNDPAETNDLAGTRPDIVSGMRGELDRWLHEAGAELPKKNVAYDAKFSPIQMFGLTMWVAHNARLRIDGGSMLLDCGDGEAYVRCLIPGPVPPGAFRVRFRVRGDRHGGISLRYTEAGSKALLEVPVEGILQGEWQTFSANVPAEAARDLLRLDFEGGPGGVEIEWVRIETPEGQLIRAFES